MPTYQLIALGYTTVGLATAVIFGIEYSKKKSLQLEDLKLTHTFIWITRLLVVGLFLFSAFIKINDYIGFGYKLEEYFEEFAHNFRLNIPIIKPIFAATGSIFMPYSEVMAFLVAVFEMALAAALLVGFRMRITSWLLLLLMLFFTFLTWYSQHFNAVTDCGCFGDALHLKPVESFIKDLILLLLLIPIFIFRKQIKPIPSNMVAGVFTLVMVLASAGYAYHCHENLPRIDYRAYKIGTDIQQCSTLPGPDGYPKCKDYDHIIWVPEEDSSTYFNEFSGDVLLVVMYDLDQAEADNVKESVELAGGIEDFGVQTMGLAGGGSDQAANFIEQNQLNYGISLRDVITLKTIVRSNPGYVLMRNGILIKKWHHNNAPKAEEIRKILGK